MLNIAGSVMVITGHAVVPPQYCQPDTERAVLYTYMISDTNFSSGREIRLE
jgi:hypothetical protein